MRQKIITISSDMIISSDNFYIIFAIEIFKVSLNGKKKETVNSSNYYLSLQLYSCGIRMYKFKKKIVENYKMDN